MASVDTQLTDDVFVITLNKPEVRNAFNPEMIDGLTEAFREADMSDCRVVYLKGEGKSFCAGADLNWMRSMKDYSLEENLADSKKLYNMFNTGRNCSAPIVCKAQGHVMGGATGLLSISDIVVAEASTKFAFSEVKLGLSPATISPFVLRKMTASKARELMLTGRVFLAEEALEGQLVNRVVTEDEIDAEVTKQLEQFMSLGPKAVRETKKLVNTVSNPLFNGLEEETAKVIAGLRVGDDGQEGLAAFFEKRDASWKRKGH
ncbi:MAG: enoyl-CoA hydratase/isomerase family protein [Bdellovibrionales bacterium]|nr:enoyl-CoA hydratase/isomerase family protein [Bdellovibrionales bacterium]